MKIFKSNHNVPYFLEIPLPSKCRRMFLTTHPNEHHPRNLATW